MTVNSSTRGNGPSFTGRKLALIVAARAQFASMAESDNPLSALGMIQTLLKKAGAGYEVLDPSGRSSARDIRRSIDTIVALHGIDEPVPGVITAKPARALSQTLMIPFEQAGKAGGHLAIHLQQLTLKGWHRFLRIGMTRRVAGMWLCLAGIVTFFLLTGLVLALVDNYAVYRPFPALLREREGIILAVLGAAMLPCGLAFYFHARGKFRYCFRISGAIVAVAAIAIGWVEIGTDYSLSDLPELRRAMELPLPTALDSSVHSSIWSREPMQHHR